MFVYFILVFLMKLRPSKTLGKIRVFVGDCINDVRFADLIQFSFNYQC